jgi:hypothetical protein
LDETELQITAYGVKIARIQEKQDPVQKASPGPHAYGSWIIRGLVERWIDPGTLNLNLTVEMPGEWTGIRPVRFSWL